ncbi:MlaD family protein [Sanyastnella coralliicola]|uniref:MlaD family protein n=1 Tax=Sanyastnella coralliicola TaxID=3069118 RepID=UPI0027BA30DF|nr:MlaD family protein [Longitalea sp. SCSIO 12813]
MKGVSKEFKIGVIVVVSLTLLIFGINYLKGINIFVQQRTFFAVYDDVDGLSVANPVILNGFKIGQVKTVGFHPKGDGSLMVEFSIDQKDLNVPVDSKAKIFSSDLFGSKAIQIIMGDSTLMANPKDTLESEIEMGLAESVRLELMPLKNKTDELIAGVDDIVENLKTVFDDDATQGLPKVFESLQRTMETLEKTTLRLDETIANNSDRIDGIFADVHSITTNLKSNNEKLNNIISNFDTVSDSLAKLELSTTLKKADVALGEFADIMTKINEGEGTMAQLINNDSLHTSLLNTNQELQYLINDLYMNPWRYVHVSIFGKKPKEKFSRRELEQLRELIDEQLDEPSSEE